MNLILSNGRWQQHRSTPRLRNIGSLKNKILCANKGTFLLRKRRASFKAESALRKRKGLKRIGGGGRIYVLLNWPFT